jgi:hypothetical protein
MSQLGICIQNQSSYAMTNVRHQVKSRFYYLFWGAMAASVVAGQLFVAAGYNRMADTAELLLYRLENESFERTVSLQNRGDKFGPGY